MLLRSARPDFLQQTGEHLQARGRNMAELALVELANGLVKTFQEIEARRGDAGLDDAAIFGVAGAGDETALFHAVEQAGHVRIVGDHAIPNAAAGEAGGLGAAEDAEDIVLGSSKAMRLKELLGLQTEEISGFQEGHKEEILQGKRRGGASRTHASTIVVITNIVKRKIWRATAGGYGLRRGRT